MLFEIENITVEETDTIDPICDGCSFESLRSRITSLKMENVPSLFENKISSPYRPRVLVEKPDRNVRHCEGRVHRPCNSGDSDPDTERLARHLESVSDSPRSFGELDLETGGFARHFESHVDRPHSSKYLDQRNEKISRQLKSRAMREYSPEILDQRIGVSTHIKDPVMHWLSPRVSESTILHLYHPSANRKISSELNFSTLRAETVSKDPNVFQIECNPTTVTEFRRDDSKIFKDTEYCLVDQEDSIKCRMKAIREKLDSGLGTIEERSKLKKSLGRFDRLTSSKHRESESNL